MLDKGHYHSIRDAAWSPDGKWCAYSFGPTETTRSIKLCRIETGETWLLTEPEFNDFAPAWDPDGNTSIFSPIANSIRSTMRSTLISVFLRRLRPLLITLQETLGNPFVPEPRPLEEEKEDKDKEEDKNEEDADKASDEKSEKKEKPEPITIDLEGISQRVVAFPYPRGRYGQIAGIEGKVIFTAFPGEETPSGGDSSGGPRGTLHVYDFKEQKKDTLVSGIDGFRLSRDAKTLVYVAGNRLRVIRAGKKVEAEKPESKAGPNRQTGLD